MRHGKDDEQTVRGGGGRHHGCSLNSQPEGCRCRIRSVGGTTGVRQRLMDLGFVPDGKAVVVRSAPLNDPIQVRLGDDNVSIRRAEAALIEVDDDE
ncbi:MAG: ferrous iron transport protein A [Rhodospirillales bacterium]|nr:ferrous iron transport protein A [Rhodospirillales bacterium]